MILKRSLKDINAMMLVLSRQKNHERNQLYKESFLVIASSNRKQTKYDHSCCYLVFLFNPMTGRIGISRG